jgi:hypothetical protein
MLDADCAEKFCKDCLEQIPEKDREAVIQELKKLYQDIGKGLGTCCQSRCSCGEIKEK